LTFHIETTKKNHHIELLRKNIFNCFPIPKRPQTDKNQKGADYRYDASRTAINQPIKENENYGYIPINGAGNAIIDFDNKERYRKYCESLIQKGYLVIETPHGWHVPVMGLTGKISKIDLFDYDLQPDKKIIEIQGPDSYCVGIGSVIWDDDTNFTTQTKYENKGSEKIWDLGGIPFDNLINDICKSCNVVGAKKTSRSSYQNLRNRFKEGKIPLKETSNDYFFQAGIQCKLDGMLKEKAIEKIGKIYDEWEKCEYFSGRTWEDIEEKINKVYDHDDNFKGGHPRGSSKQIDRTKISCDMIEDRVLFSDTETGEIFENKNGFLEKINKSLVREIMENHKGLEQSDYNSILFKLLGLAQPMPKTNKNLIVFKNGTRDIKTKELMDTDNIADLGFKEYDYLPDTEENKPVNFIKIMFENVDKSEHTRIKAGLRSVLSNYLDPRISVIYGNSGVGKSTALLILVKILNDYALAVELDQLLSDKFIRAKIRGLRLLVLQDLPLDWKNFTIIKALTGEQIKSERGFMQDLVKFENKIKIFGSCNYLPKIPENEKNAMYGRRLSLIHNMRKDPYPENFSLIDDIAEEEGEKIISWILNLKDEDCRYEDSKTIKDEWEKLASPEIEFLENNYDITDITCDTSIKEIVKDFKEKYPEAVMDIPTMKKSLESQGYIIKFNVIKNIKVKVKK
jgi:hypothetical protein